MHNIELSSTAGATPNMLGLLKKVLIRHEGKVSKVYLDSLGYPTAGVGHLLKKEDKHRAIGSPVTKEEVDAWFDADIEEAIRIARSLVPKLDSLDEVRQTVIISLAFNLGPKLKQFVNTLAYVNAEQWEKAANNLQQSLWFKQVKRRGPELVEALRTGVIGFPIN